MDDRHQRARHRGRVVVLDDVTPVDDAGRAEPDHALAAITKNPAQVWGIDSSYGTLEAGKDADVVIWDGDPLDVTSAPTAVFIKGQQMPMTSRQTELRDRYRDLSKKNPPFGYR